MKRILGILFALVLAISLMMVPGALVGANPDPVTIWQIGVFDDAYNHTIDGTQPWPGGPVTATVDYEDASTFYAVLTKTSTLTGTFNADLSGGAVLLVSWSPGGSYDSECFSVSLDGVKKTSKVVPGHLCTGTLPYPDGRCGWYWSTGDVPYYTEEFDFGSVGTGMSAHTLVISYSAGDGIGFDYLKLSTRATDAVCACEVVTSSQGTLNNGSPIPSGWNRSNPEYATGAPGDGYFFSLGFVGGSIELEFCDLIGGELTVYEITNYTSTGGDYPEEYALVEGSLDGITWTDIGIANNLAGKAKDPVENTNPTTFDLGDASYKYIRITDDSVAVGWPPYTSLDGFDLDAVCAEPFAGPQVLPLDHFLGYKVKTTKVCDGGVTELTLLNTGPEGVITVTTKDGVVFEREEVDSGVQFSFGTAGVKLGTSIDIFVNDVLATTIHTSCSQPIYQGLTFGDFEVVEGESLKGGPLETPALKFGPEEVTLTDQFATGLFKVEKPDKFYNPAEKNGSEINNPNTHLMSYKVKLVEYLEPEPACASCKGGLTSLKLRYNGLSTAFVAVTGGSEPFEETLNPGDDFTIVGGGKDGKLDKDVTITVGGELKAKIHTSCSQPIGTGQTFGDFTVVAGESKDGGPLCPIITVESQFGAIAVARDKPDRLLIPTAKSRTGPVDELDETGVDHFLGYKIKAPKDTPEFQVFLVDQFGQLKLYDVKKPTRLYVPVDKNGGGINNPEAHLICYTIKLAKDQEKHEGVRIYTNNQFGPLRLNTDKEVELLVPCQKILP